jgi:hypothetical protein
MVGAGGVADSAVTDVIPSPPWSARTTATPTSRASATDGGSTIIDTTDLVHVHAVSRPFAAGGGCARRCSGGSCCRLAAIPVNRPRKVRTGESRTREAWVAMALARAGAISTGRRDRDACRTTTVQLPGVPFYFGESQLRGEAHRARVGGLGVEHHRVPGDRVVQPVECRFARLGGLAESPRLRQEQVGELGLPGAPSIIAS